MVVHCDLVRSKSNNSLDPSVTESLCVSRFGEMGFSFYVVVVSWRPIFVLIYFTSFLYFVPISGPPFQITHTSI